MKIKKIISILSVLLTAFVYGQNVQVKITNIKVNNVSIPIGSGINFGNSPTIQLNFRIELEKLADYSIGNCRLRIRSYRSSGSYIEHFIGNVFPSNFVDYTYGDYVYTLYSSDYDANSENYLKAILVQDNSPGASWESNQVPILKAPTFTLSPTSLSIPCGDTSARTFSVTPANIPSGANVTYQWSYSGWNGSNSTSSSITLSPASGSISPSTVSVTPIINGVAQNSITATVSRPSFTSKATISGSNSICTPATTGSYSISGLLAGQSVTWSSSNTAIATVSPTTGNTVTVNRVSNGTFNLIARVTNQCGQFVNVPPRSIRFGGAPLFTVQQNTGSASNHEFLTLKGINNANIANEQITNVVWEEVQLNNEDCGDVFGGGGVNAYVDYYVNNCNMQVKVTATNSCGSTTVFKTVQNNRISGGTEARLSQNNYTIFPNPAKDVVTIELRDKENQTKKNTIISGELFDMMGQSKSKVQIIDSKATFSVRELKKGIYILKIYINDQVEIHQIAVE